MGFYNIVTCACILSYITKGWNHRHVISTNLSNYLQVKYAFPSTIYDMLYLKQNFLSGIFLNTFV